MIFQKCFFLVNDLVILTNFEKFFVLVFFLLCASVRVKGTWGACSTI